VSRKYGLGGILRYPRQPSLDGTSRYAGTQLLDQVRSTAPLKHYSLSTEDSYVNWMKRFILHHRKRHPAEMGEDEIRHSLTHLAVAGRVAASTQTVALSALLIPLPGRA
jgi:hypothetical protein